MTRTSATPTVCLCGGASDERPSGDRVCRVCGRVWTIGDVIPQVPEP